MSKRVLFLERNVDGTIGGSHICLLEICRSLDRSRYQPVVRFYQDNVLVQEFREAGAQVIVRPPPRRWDFASRVRGPLRMVLQIPQSLGNLLATFVADTFRWLLEIRRLQVDVVHLNNSCDGDFGLMLAARICRRPLVIHQRGFAAPLDPLGRWVAGRASSIIAISVAVRDDLVSKGLPARRIALVHDGIDPERVRALPERSAEVRAAAGIEPGEPVIGIVGNLKHWKGQHVVLGAVALLHQRFPRIRCLLVGASSDPRYLDSLKGMADAAGIAGNVVFTGYQRNPAQWMSLMDVVIHASVEPEPFGIVLLEAMALGKPVVATNRGGPRDVILEGETGLLVPPGDASALADAVSRVIVNPEMARRMGEAGRVRMHAQFTAARNARRVEEIYSRILRSYARRA